MLLNWLTIWVTCCNGCVNCCICWGICPASCPPELTSLRSHLHDHLHTLLHAGLLARVFLMLPSILAFLRSANGTLFDRVGLGRNVARYQSHRFDRGLHRDAFDHCVANHTLGHEGCCFCEHCRRCRLTNSGYHNRLHRHEWLEQQVDCGFSVIRLHRTSSLIPHPHEVIHLIQPDRHGIDAEKVGGLQDSVSDVVLLDLRNRWCRRQGQGV